MVIEVLSVLSPRYLVTIVGLGVVLFQLYRRRELRSLCERSCSSHSMMDSYFYPLDEAEHLTLPKVFYSQLNRNRVVP